MNDNEIKSILRKSKTIAMIGVSSEKKGEDTKNLKRKPANVVMKYMQNFGYKVIPSNPFAVGEIVNGDPMIESLDKLKEEIDSKTVEEIPSYGESKAKREYFLAFSLSLFFIKRSICLTAFLYLLFLILLT